MLNQRMIDASYALASSRQMCCKADLDLLVFLLDDLNHAPRVVQLGAGSGTMALAILGVRDDLTLWTFDNNRENLAWESKALQNAGFNIVHEKRYRALFSDSAAAGRKHFDGRLDLIVIDADHSYRGVKRDLVAWGEKAGLVFCHDYDGTTAPRRYPGVARACDEYFGRPPLLKAGWSAVFAGVKA